MIRVCLVLRIGLLGSRTAQLLPKTTLESCRRNLFRKIYLKRQLAWFDDAVSFASGDIFMSQNFSIKILLKKRIILTIGGGAFLVSGSLMVASKRAQDRAAAATNNQANQHPSLIAGPGRVEPASEDIKIGSELSGRLKAVNVEEGDAIHRGQVLAVLENADYRAQVESARANVEAKAAVLRKVVNGARRQQRDEAWSSVKEANAVMEETQSELHRRQQLFSAGVVSREELDRCSREAAVAKARYDAAVQQHALIDDRAREEDQSFAEADLELAQGQLAEAEARYGKSFIRSP